jgi:hypothetical protein
MSGTVCQQMLYVTSNTYSEFKNGLLNVNLDNFLTVNSIVLWGQRQ